MMTMGQARPSRPPSYTGSSTCTAHPLRRVRDIMTILWRGADHGDGPRAARLRPPQDTIEAKVVVLRGEGGRFSLGIDSELRWIIDGHSRLQQVGEDLCRIEHSRPSSPSSGPVRGRRCAAGDGCGCGDCRLRQWFSSMIHLGFLPGMATTRRTWDSVTPATDHAMSEAQCG